MAGTSPAMTKTCGSGNHRRSRELISLYRENCHGTKIFEKSRRQGRSRDEEAQGRHAEERSLRAQGQEPQAGHCDRSFRGKGCRSQGPEEKESGEEAQGEGGEAIGLSRHCRA